MKKNKNIEKKSLMIAIFVGYYDLCNQFRLFLTGFKQTEKLVEIIDNNSTKIKEELKKLKSTYSDLDVSKFPISVFEEIENIYFSYRKEVEEELQKLLTLITFELSNEKELQNDISSFIFEYAQLDKALQENHSDLEFMLYKKRIE